MTKIAISACLAGKACRYDGKSVPCKEIDDLTTSKDAHLICPEVLGGLPTPRVPAEIVGGDGFDVLDGRARVVAKDGTDVTKAFLDGAHKALAQLKKEGITLAYLKSRSPSCGAKQIYDGTFSGQVVEGCGVTAALLLKNGIEVVPK